MKEELLKDYLNMGFNDEQLKEIYKGLLNGIDVEQYSKPDFSASEMYAIRRKLKSDKIAKCRLTKKMQIL